MNDRESTMGEESTATYRHIRSPSRTATNRQGEDLIPTTPCLVIEHYIAQLNSIREAALRTCSPKIGKTKETFSDSSSIQSARDQRIPSVVELPWSDLPGLWKMSTARPEVNYDTFLSFLLDIHNSTNSLQPYIAPAELLKQQLLKRSVASCPMYLIICETSLLKHGFRCPRGLSLLVC